LLRQQVIKLRQHHGWSQQKLANKLQLAGGPIVSRTTFSKIAGGALRISDYDLLLVS
jgi:transcriptional regulator with XRE-family HTH domain